MRKFNDPADRYNFGMCVYVYMYLCMNVCMYVCMYVCM